MVQAYGAWSITNPVWFRSVHLARYSPFTPWLSLARKVAAHGFELLLRHGAVLGDLSQQVARCMEQAFADAARCGLRRVRLRG